MPCYTKVQTQLLDIASIEAAAGKLGITVRKYNENFLRLSTSEGEIELTRDRNTDKFTGQNGYGKYEAILQQLVPAYAKIQLQKFARAKGYTISQGNDASEYILSKYE